MSRTNIADVLFQNKYVTEYLELSEASGKLIKEYNKAVDTGKWYWRKKPNEALAELLQAKLGVLTLAKDVAVSNMNKHQDSLLVEVKKF